MENPTRTISIERRKERGKRAFSRRTRRGVIERLRLTKLSWLDCRRRRGRFGLIDLSIRSVRRGVETLLGRRGVMERDSILSRGLSGERGARWMMRISLRGWRMFELVAVGNMMVSLPLSLRYRDDADKLSNPSWKSVEKESFVSFDIPSFFAIVADSFVISRSHSHSHRQRVQSDVEGEDYHSSRSHNHSKTSVATTPSMRSNHTGRPSVGASSTGRNKLSLPTFRGKDYRTSAAMASSSSASSRGSPVIGRN